MTPQALLARERGRALAWAAGIALPWLALALVSLWRDPASPLRWLLLAAAVIAIACAAAWAWQAHDARWLARRLDHAPELEDSADLLFALDPADSPLADLQRRRIAGRFATADLRRWLPQRPLWPVLASLLLAAVGIAWLLRPAVPAALLQQLPAPVAQALRAGPPVVQAVHMDVQPPAYTGLPRRTLDSADARVAQSSRVRWRLRIGGDVRAAWLQWDDGSRLPLQREGDAWTATRSFERGALYRIATEPALPAAQSGLHRIEVVADQPPQVRAVQPAKPLELRQAGQRQWTLRFVASDDHGVAPTATLRIIQTAGEGENITSSERTLALAGRGTRTRREFAHAIDLARSGLTAGNDLIVQLTVRDNRQPQPHVVRSASVILRWPPERAGETGGLELLLKRALPAYFRSQRQIIIDAEKLLAERPALSAEAFGRRSDLLGVDQRALRLRYGQFMGEEAEDGPPPPTSDVADEDAHDEDDQAASHEGHDHASPTTGAPLDFAAAAEAVAAEMAHTHDIPEAATFFDPETREMLRAALREMGSSEGALRSHDPAAALPFANRALALIKQLQEAERVYLPRLGSELPPVDMGRRLSGKRDGLAPRANPFVARPQDADPLAMLWQALASGTADERTVTAARAALRGQVARDGAMAALVALDTWERDPACRDCGTALRNALWPLLRAASPTPAPRHQPDAGGQAYLDALQRGGRP